MANVVYTIGHSNHEQQKFFNLLSQHAIDVLVDVRSQPYSKYASQFNTHQLGAALPELGVKYLFMGDQLGGRPQSDEFYDEAGYVLYHRVAEAAYFVESINRIIVGAEKMKVALMCSEEDPSVCHRFLLVSRVLTDRGVDVRHIRGDGSVQVDDALRSTSKQHSRQGMLFPEVAEDAWRSLKPICPR